VGPLDFAAWVHALPSNESKRSVEVCLMGIATRNAAAPRRFQALHELMSRRQFTFVVPTKNGMPATGSTPPHSKAVHSVSVPPSPQP